MIVLTFALPDESRAFVASLTGREYLAEGKRLPVVTGSSRGRSVAVIHTGVGEIAFYRQRLEAFLRAEKPRLLISSGYAGGLQPELAVGDLVLGENVSDAKNLQSACGALASLGPLHRGAIITLATALESAESKQATGRRTGAAAVDMETGWIADVCAAEGVPLLALRGISDAMGEAFPVPGKILFDANRQCPRYLALPAWLLCHPGQIRPFIRFVRGVGLARRKLAAALQTLIAGL